MRRQNPRHRLPASLIPPRARSRIALHLTSAAARGLFELQVCESCGGVQYPPREACARCLSVELVWRAQEGRGELLSETTLAHSNEPYFRERLPWRVGLVRLDVGASLIVHVHADVERMPARVRVRAHLDRSGQAALVAYPEHSQGESMASDDRLNELRSDPRGRRVLVTDGTSVTGAAIVRALLGAGASLVWAGTGPETERSAAFLSIAPSSQVIALDLDPTSGDSVGEAAARIGGKVDILVNNLEFHRSFGIANRAGLDVARREMEANYFGLLRLAQAFGPGMRARAADGTAGATAWVNVLSIFALSNWPTHGTFSASKAAALSLAQCLRAEMQPAGIRVVNVFPGPLDDEWNQAEPPPKLAPEALARAIVQALQAGQEDVYPGEVAQEFLERWRSDPKVLERELSVGR